MTQTAGDKLDRRIPLPYRLKPIEPSHRGQSHLFEPHFGVQMQNGLQRFWLE